MKKKNSRWVFNQILLKIWQSKGWQAGYDFFYIFILCWGKIQQRIQALHQNRSCQFHFQLFKNLFDQKSLDEACRNLIYLYFSRDKNCLRCCEKRSNIHFVAIYSIICCECWRFRWANRIKSTCQNIPEALLAKEGEFSFNRKGKGQKIIKALGTYKGEGKCRFILFEWQTIGSNLRWIETKRDRRVQIPPTVKLLSRPGNSFFEIFSKSINFVK